MLLRMGAGTAISLRWVDRSGGEIDPTTGARVGGTVTAREAIVRGFVHYVGATTSLRQFREIEVGDAIIDLPPDTIVDGLPELRVEIDGATWVPKDAGERLQRFWDAIEQGQRLSRTLLLRKAA